MCTFMMQTSVHRTCPIREIVVVSINTAHTSCPLTICITSSRISSSLPAKTFSTHNTPFTTCIILSHSCSCMPVMTMASMDTYWLRSARSFVSIAAKYSTQISSGLSSIYSALFVVGTSRRLRYMAVVRTGDLPSSLQRGDKNSSVPRRHTSSITSAGVSPCSSGLITKRRYSVGSIQLPLEIASTSCSMLKARSSEMSWTMSSKMETKSNCIGNRRFQNNYIVKNTRSECEGDSDSASYRGGKGKTGGRSCEKQPTRSTLDID
jgi:hypothetical protein